MYLEICVDMDTHICIKQKLMKGYGFEREKRTGWR